MEPLYNQISKEPDTLSFKWLDLYKGSEKKLLLQSTRKISVFYIGN
jgi:hypothetical protein